MEVFPFPSYSKLFNIEVVEKNALADKYETNFIIGTIDMKNIFIINFMCAYNVIRIFKRLI